MNSCKNLILHDDGTVYHYQLTSLLSSRNIPYTSVGILHLFNAVDNPANVIALINTDKNTINNILSLQNKTLHHADLLIINPLTLGDGLDNVEAILKSSYIKNNGYQIQSISLIEKVVRLELQSIGIENKYIGFKYLAELLTQAIINQDNQPYTLNKIENIAISNNISLDSAERDIRHLLTSSKPTLLHNQIIDQNLKHSTKQTINNIFKYLKNIIFN